VAGPNLRIHEFRNEGQPGEGRIKSRRVKVRLEADSRSQAALFAVEILLEYRIHVGAGIPSGFRPRWERSGGLSDGRAPRRQGWDIQAAMELWADYRAPPTPAVNGGYAGTDTKFQGIDAASGAERSGFRREAAARRRGHHVTGYIDTSKAILRDYVRATIRFLITHDPQPI
jgi:hypothetical protein